jgi:hypothetical protein
MNRETLSPAGAARLVTNAPAHGLTAVFRSMARLRQAPAVHPRGVTLASRLTVDQQIPFIPQGDHHATVRLSKGAGTPGGWPDVLGLALRLHLQEPAEPCDFLFSSAGDGRWSRWLPVPAGDWNATRYGTLAPYESAGRWWWLMAIPTGSPIGHASLQKLENDALAGFTVHISDESADWQQIGRLDLHERIDGSGLDFDPVLNHPRGALPAPSWLRELRERAYSGSRQGHGAAPPCA